MKHLVEFWDSRSSPRTEPGNLYRGSMGPVLLDGVDVTNRCFRIEHWDDGTQVAWLYVMDGSGIVIRENERAVTERRVGKVVFPELSIRGLSVIIPSRTLSNLEPCAAAVAKYDPSCDVIVVWDKSRGNQWIPTSHQYKICDVDTPFIFSRNCNIGIAAAGDNDVIILNDDGLLKTPGGFRAMQRVADENPEWGVISSSCNNVGNQNQWPRPRFVAALPGTDITDQRSLLREEDRTLCFVCVLIPRRTIELVGLLDECFVNYGLDDDSYCLRVRRAGLKLGIFDGSFVDHHSLKSTYRAPSPTNSSPGNFLPNMKIFIEKYGFDNWGRDREHSPYRDLFPPEKVSA